LLELARRQSEALRRNDTASLAALAREMAGPAARLAENEQLRLAVQGRLALVLDLPEGAGLGELLLRSPDDIKELLAEVTPAISDQLKNLVVVNEINRLLTRRAINFNEKLLEVLNPGSGRTYRSTGEVRENGGSVSLINRTV